MIKIINVYKDSRVMEMTSSSNLGLGVRTDNDVDLLRFTFDEMIVGTAQLLTSLTDEYGELVAFPLTLNQSENSYDIEVTKYLASQGNFTIQLEITTNGMIWHSKQAEVILDDCLAVGEGDMPSVVDNWLQNANIVLAEMEEATTGAEKVNVEVEEVDDTYEVTFTDRNGIQTEATIYQGKNANVVGSYDTSDTNAYSTNYVNNQISTPLSQETTNRQNADNELQSQIDAITVSSDVVDIVGTYQDLQNYDTQHIKANDIIKVLQDSTHNDALSYYRWVITQNVGSWVYVGSEGPFYTKSETDSLLNNKVDTTTFNTSQQAQDTLIANKVNTSTYNQGQATQDTKITNLENQVFGDETIESEGTSLTLDGTLKGQFNSIDLKGNTSQTGTPTPTSPIPVNVVSGDNEIVVNGKNWFDKDNVNLFNGYINASGVMKSSTNDRTIWIKVIPNTNYTFKMTQKALSSSTSGDDIRIALYDTQPILNAEGTILYSASRPSATTDYTYEYTFNSGNNKYVAIKILNTERSNYDETINTIMINIGETALPYEPYNGDTYNIDLPEGMELCRIGNYQDYFYKDSDKWYLHKEIGKVVLNGSENKFTAMSNYTNCQRLGITISDCVIAPGYYVGQNIIRTPYFVNENKTLDNVNKQSGVIVSWNVTGYQYCSFEPNTFTDLADSNNWLTTHNIPIYYALATPTDTEVEYQPLIDQLNLLEQAMSKENQTNISQVNNDLPFIISASAFLNNLNGKIALLNKLTEV